MRSLPLPLRNEHADFTLCIARRKPDESALLKQCEAVIHNSYSNYEEIAFAHGQLAGVDERTAKVLAENFRLLDAGRPLHELRASILMMGAYDRCPYCNRAPAAAIDHHLPKTPLPHFAVMARNLVPICDRCNRRKSSTQRVSPNHRFFHPYYDDFREHRLLQATATVDSIVDLDFSIDTACGAPTDVIDIAQFTFIQLDLRQFFIQESYDEVGDLATAMENEFDSGGVGAVNGFLAQIRDSCTARYGNNHWRSSLYDALATSYDFCAGGFRGLLPGETEFI